MSLITPRDATWPSVARRANAMSSDAPASGRTRIHEGEICTAWTRLDTAVATSRGARHSVNEDCHSRIDRSTPLFVVADGVGGGALASRASRELVSRLHASLDRVDADASAMRAALLDADRAIARSIASRTDASGAATVALCKGAGATLSRWLVAWVGDCRVYRMRAGRDDRAQLLTLDDTYRQLNEQPPRGGSPDDPARMVGNGAVDTPNVRSVALRPGEMLVLCSDGVHKHAAPSDIARLLGGHSPLARRCRGLVEFARARGSRDDATVLVVERAERRMLRLARIALASLALALVCGALLWVGVASGMVLPATAQSNVNNAGRQP